MDHDLNNLNQFLGDQDSFHLQASTQDRTIRKPSVEVKQLQQLISPANIPHSQHYFNLRSPSPFKHGISYFDEEEASDNCESRYGLGHTPAKKIHSVIAFDQSPKLKKNQNFNNGTASSQRFVNRSGSTKPQPLIIKQDKKNSKGLRNLSESVFRIVKEFNVTTYKEVADQLVRMLNAGEFGPLQQETTKAKDEQNIKRRVYDALNVLISADVLRKDGKHVMSQHDSMNEKNRHGGRGGKKEDKDNLWDQIVKKQNQLRQKKQKIEQLKNKKQILSAILKRNKKKKLLQKDKITFPLIGVTYHITVPKIIRTDSRSRVSLPMTNSIEIVGDMDLLVKAGIDVLSQNIEEIMEQVNGQHEFEGAKKKTKASPAPGHGRTKTPRVLYSL